MSSALPELQGHARAAQSASPRAFGGVMATVLAGVALWPLLAGLAPRWWALGLALGLAALALWWPQGLALPNRLWLALGAGLHRLTAPLAMLLVFVLGFLTTGLALRLLGKDPLRRARDPAAQSYWIPRDPPGQADAQMRRLF